MLQILGFTGDLRPYLPANDNTVTVLLVICFFIISLTLASNKKLFTELGAVFFNKKNKVTNYRNAVSTNIISLSPLILQASLLMGVIIYIFLKVNFNDNIASYPPWLIIGLTTVITLAYLAINCSRDAGISQSCAYPACSLGSSPAIRILDRTCRNSDRNAPGFRETGETKRSPA